MAWRAAVLTFVAILALGPGPARPEEPGPLAPDAHFDRAIAPLLARRCLDCHAGPDAKGGLDLAHRERALAGGDSGPAIVPSRPDESLLWQYVDDGTMPPKERLTGDEKAAIREWIASGAAWGTDPIDPFQATTARRAGRDWWSLQPVRRPEVPEVADASTVRNAIDRFVNRRLEDRHLSPRPEADRRTLIRRLTFDLLGLPPTPGEVDAFLGDPRPDAYERLVDRLLASPHYGVRWARLWLDLARYGESHGFEHDEFRPNAWRYRDWVVHALNADLPYNAFARLQLAGDVLQPEDPGAITATGFLVAGAYDSVGQSQQSEAMRQVVRQDEMEDLIGTVGQTFLGLTLHCARCHDHKFDPVRQSEYYRLAAALDGVRHGERLLNGDDPEVSALQAEVDALEARARRASGDEKKALEEQLGSLRARLEPIALRTYAVAPRPAGVARVLIRGNPKQPGEVVSAGGVAALRGIDPEFGLAPDAPEDERRRRLAGWIAGPDNPLFARVMVNRLWQAHFGTGLVETPSDFGFNGGRPSHPELLDWLAAEFVARGWSLKAMHRLIVTSAAYRRGGGYDAELKARDADGRLIGRRAPRRLEAEMVRDAMLAVSGRLDVRLDGPGFREHAISKAVGTITHRYDLLPEPGPDANRRTLYRTWARGGRSGMLDVLDCPDPSTTAPRRAVTTTPLQALTLLNHRLVLDLADAFARRLQQEAGTDPDAQAELAYRLALARPPTDEERAEAADVVRRHGAAALARAIFNCNEFLYVD